MITDASHALVGTGIAYRPVREDVGDHSPAGVRPGRPPVEQILEGELLGRQHQRAAGSAGLFDSRQRYHASAETSHAHRGDLRNRAALAAYHGTAAASETCRPRTALDLYA